MTGTNVLGEYTASSARVEMSKVGKVAGYVEEGGSEWIMDNRSILLTSGLGVTDSHGLEITECYCSLYSKVAQATNCLACI
jgi:hypothetical protein